MTRPVTRLLVLVALSATAAGCGGARHHLSADDASKTASERFRSADPAAKVTAWSCPSSDLDFDAKPAYQCSGTVTQFGRPLRFRVDLRSRRDRYSVTLAGLDGAWTASDIARQAPELKGRVVCPQWLDLHRRDLTCRATLPSVDAVVPIAVQLLPDGNVSYRAQPSNTAGATSAARAIEQSISLYLRAATSLSKPVTVSCPDDTTFGQPARCSGTRRDGHHVYHYVIRVKLGQPGHVFPHGVDVTSPDDHTGEIVDR